MRFRNTLILALVFVALGAYLYFVEFQRAAEEKKKKTLFTFESDAVSAVTLTYPDREIALRLTDGAWRIATPIDAAADETAVKNLVRAIAECEVKKTLDEVPQDLAPFGLDTPKVTVKVTLKDRELPAIRVGKTTPVGYSTYIQRADEPKIYLTTSAFQSGMEKQVKDLRDKRIVQFNEDDVRQVALQSEAQTIRLRKADNKWQLEQPGAFAADSATVRNFLSTLRALHATDFPAEEASDLKTYGLDAPRLTVTLSIGEKLDEVQVLFGGQSDKKDVYIKTNTRPTIFTAAEYAYKDLNKSANDFRDKTVLAIDKQAVSEIEVARNDGEAFVLARSEDGKWSIRGNDGQPDAQKIDQFLGDLVDLKGYEIVTDEPADLGTYGLATPVLTISVRGKDAASLGTARFGSHTPKPPVTEYTAMRDGQSTVYHVREYQFTRLNKKASDFLPKPTATPTPAVSATPTPSAGAK